MSFLINEPLILFIYNFNLTEAHILKHNPIRRNLTDLTLKKYIDKQIVRIILTIFFLEI